MFVLSFRTLLSLSLAVLVAASGNAHAAETQHAQGRGGFAAFTDLDFDADGNLSVDGSIVVRLVRLPVRSTTGVVTGYGTWASAPMPGFADLGDPWISVERRDRTGSTFALTCRSLANIADSSVTDSTYRTEITAQATCGGKTYTVRWLYDALTFGNHTAYRRFAWEYPMLPASGVAVNVAINGNLGMGRATVCEPASGWCTSAFSQDVWRLFDTNINALRS